MTVNTIYKKGVKVATALCLLLAANMQMSCTDPKEGELFVEPTTEKGEMSIVGVLESAGYNGQFSSWISLLKQTNFYNALKDGSAKATAFCPTNEAMAQFLASRGVSSVDELVAKDPAYAKALVQEHIINKKKIFYNEVVLLAQNKDQYETPNLYGELLQFTYGYHKTDIDDKYRVDDFISVDTIYINQQARMGRFEADTCQNGVLYVMADVIKPTAETIYQTLLSDPTYSIFAQAVKDCGFESVANKFEALYNEEGERIGSKYNYTCFAVPDEIYNAKGIRSVEDLKNYLMSQGGYSSAAEALRAYVEYHFLTYNYTTTELFNFIGDESVLVYPVQLKGGSVIANKVTDPVTGKLQKTINNDIEILRSDTKVANGYITKVGDIMPVFYPDPVQMKWDFLNSADLINIVNTYGRASSLGDLFTSPMTTSNSTKYDFVASQNIDTYGQPTSFTNYTGATDVNSKGTYPEVGFYKDFLTTGKATYEAYLQNILCLNMGFGGWVEFNTPSIIAGKYKMVLHYFADKDNMNLISNSFFTDGTDVRMEFDGNLLVKRLYKGVTFTRTQKYKALEATMSEEIEFTETKSHKLKITFRDVLAKTSSRYHVYLDYIEFIPL